MVEKRKFTREEVVESADILQDATDELTDTTTDNLESMRKKYAHLGPLAQQIIDLAIEDAQNFSKETRADFMAGFGYEEDNS